MRRVGPNGRAHEDEDEQHLQGRKRVLEPAAPRDARSVDGGAEEHDAGRQVGGRQAREDRGGVVPKGNGGKCGGPRKAECRRDPPGNEAERGVVQLRDEMVLAPGAGKGGAQLPVGEGPAERDDAPYRPQHEEREGGVQVLHLKPDAGENAGADHVGHYERGGGQQAHLDGRAVGRGHSRRRGGATGREAGRRGPRGRVTAIAVPERFRPNENPLAANGNQGAVPERGLEPPRPITATWPSTMRVYQFRHSGRSTSNCESGMTSVRSLFRPLFSAARHSRTQ